MALTALAVVAVTPGAIADLALGMLSSGAPAIDMAPPIVEGRVRRTQAGQGCDAGGGQRGFTEHSYAATAGEELEASYRFGPDRNLSFRNIQWSVYLAPYNHGSPKDLSAAVVRIPVGGPTEVAEAHTVEFPMVFVVPANISGRALMGMAWTAEARFCEQEWNRVELSSFAATMLVIEVRETPFAGLFLMLMAAATGFALVRRGGWR